MATELEAGWPLARSLAAARPFSPSPLSRRGLLLLLAVCAARVHSLFAQHARLGDYEMAFNEQVFILITGP